jgi:hypothetical protein
MLNLAPEARMDLDRPVIESYPTQSAAEHAVDHLARNGFPIERVAIVGSDLRLAETIIGRLTRGRAALAGFSAGMWFGSMTGLLLALFTTTKNSPLALILGGALYGAVFGSALSLVLYAADRHRHAFASTSTVVAARYDVIADADVAEDAKNLLIKLAWRERP